MAVGSSRGMMVGGVVADRLGGRDARWRMWAPMAGSVALAPLIMPQYLTPDAGLSLTVGVVSFLLACLYFPTMYGCIQAIVPANLRAFTAAISVVSVNVVGMGLGP